MQTAFQLWPAYAQLAGSGDWWCCEWVGLCLGKGGRLPWGNLRLLPVVLITSLGWDQLLGLTCISCIDSTFGQCGPVYINPKQACVSQSSMPNAGCRLCQMPGAHLIVAKLVQRNILAPCTVEERRLVIGRGKYAEGVALLENGCMLYKGPETTAMVSGVVWLVLTVCDRNRRGVFHSE
jgi:hypothetical protein